MSMIRVTLETRIVVGATYPHQILLVGCDAVNWHKFLVWAACQTPESTVEDGWFCFTHANDLLRFRQHIGDKSAKPAPFTPPVTGKPMESVAAPAKVTSDDCKRFLATLDTPFMDRTERVSGLTRNKTWVRLRKYKDANGVVCRDFTNTGIPVVAVIAETPTGLTLKRMRSLGLWESAFEKHFESWHDGTTSYRSAEAWESTVMWMSFRPEDFAFGITVGEVTDTPNGHSYFFQPVTVTKGNGWDQHSAIDFLFPRAISGSEMCESTFVFDKAGQDEADVTADLLAAGFTHDPGLDNISGS
jgi:hypothetical protein